jgi:hypothetical protein
VRQDFGIEVWDVRASLPIHGEGPRLQPVVTALRARVSNGTLARLLARGGIEGRLVAGGAEITVKVQMFTVTADLVGSVPGNGRLRIEATALRLGGWLPVPANLVELALGRIEGKPGIHRAGPRAVDLDLGGLLAALPVRWSTGIRAARITPEYLEIECEER